MIIYSQRDPKWKDQKMGTGTLGQYGCLVTSISMLSGISPDILNSKIKEVNGYSGNNLIWEKLDLIKGLDFIKRVRVYENDQVAANLPCLVEVDGSPIGGVTHWVLYTGNQKCLDPWDGTQKATSSYKPIGYAVVKSLSEPTTESAVSSPQAKIEIGKLNTGTPYETDRGIMELQALKSNLSDLDRNNYNLGQDNINLRNALQIANKPTTVYVEQTVPEDPPMGSGKPTIDSSGYIPTVPSVFEVQQKSPLAKLWAAFLSVFKFGRNVKN